jgi:cob(I)alamin adenosyltransferase
MTTYMTTMITRNGSITLKMLSKDSKATEFMAFINEVVDYIGRFRHDYEAAHSIEDDLHRLVLQLIADGAENGAEMAKAALRTTELDFARYCA